MNSRSVSIFAAFAAAAAIGVVAQACQVATGRALTKTVPGAETQLGDGTVSSFARFTRANAPTAIGVLFSDGALRNLPTARTDEHRCHDHNGNGTIEPATECLPTHERVIPLPTEAARRADIPFKWVLLNWNPVGHAPQHVYGLPHFDIHFYMDAIENTFALMPGPCGPEFIRCDQFERALRPVPSNFIHPDFKNVDAAAPAMGNHLVDLTSPELHGEVFGRTWIFGSYDGRITFWEEMVTLAYLQRRSTECHDIKTPPAVAVAGYYPTQLCFRFNGETNEQSVSMEGFTYREASPPVSEEL